MKPKPRVVRNASSVGAALPRSLDELARIPGGPFALIEQAERQAGDAEARFWLDVLEHHVAQALAKGVTGDDLMLSAIVHGWLKSLRQRLGIKPSLEAIRAQTRERVRRLRARRAGG